MRRRDGVLSPASSLRFIFTMSSLAHLEKD